MVVVDASVAAKWYLKEKDSDKAKMMAAETEEFIAPTLIITEVLSGITKSCRLNNIEDVHAQFLCGCWLVHTRNGMVASVESEEDIESAITLAIKAKHAYQDCLYITLAHRLGMPLLSADEKQLSIAEQVGVEIFPLSGVTIG